MNKLDNLQATKEFELAQQIQSGINSFCFSAEAKEMMEDLRENGRYILYI
jgi:hypothetical protein